jgi:hypothetical protein
MCRPLLFAILLIGITGPPLSAVDVTPLPAPAVVPAAPGCPCPTGPPPPLILPAPGTYPQYNLPAVYLRQRSIHDGPAGYRSAPWHPLPTPPATAPPARAPTTAWWPW